MERDAPVKSRPSHARSARVGSTSSGPETSLPKASRMTLVSAARSARQKASSSPTSPICHLRMRWPKASSTGSSAPAQRARSPVSSPHTSCVGTPVSETMAPGMRPSEKETSVPSASSALTQRFHAAGSGASSLPASHIGSVIAPTCSRWASGGICSLGSALRTTSPKGLVSSIACRRDGPGVIHSRSSSEPPTRVRPAVTSISMRYHPRAGSAGRQRVTLWPAPRRRTTLSATLPRLSTARRLTDSASPVRSRSVTRTSGG